MDALIIARRGADQVLLWGDDSVSACGRCALCQAEAEDARDVLLVAGLRMTQRARLRLAGITTIDALAASTKPVQGIPAATLANLRAQAVMQLRQMAPRGTQEPAETPEAQADHAPASSVTWGWRDAAALASLPKPSDGDIFFDFEGDPLWQDEQGRYGLEYLFGIVEAPDGNAPADAKPVFAASWRTPETRSASPCSASWTMSPNGAPHGRTCTSITTPTTSVPPSSASSACTG